MMTNKAEEFDNIATGIFAPIYPVIAEQIADKTGITQGVCLDIGSAAGHLGLAIAAITGLNVILMDNSPEALAIAERRISERGYNERCKILFSDVHAIPLPDKSVDLAISRGSLWFWEDKKKAIHEIYRVLVNGGQAYIGGGFGNKELKIMIAEKMTALNNEKWEDRQKRIRGECTKEYLDTLLEETRLPFKIIDDDSGLWVILRKQE